jgi:drug/metabolite transporter (DMT)-like permease
VPLDALALALAAAVVHALWNLLTARAAESQLAAGVAIGVGGLVFAPIAALTWRVDLGAVWPYAVASVALELLYLVLLATAYAAAAMGFVYPIARGSAPVLVLIAGAIADAASPSAAATVGVVVVATGIVLVRGLRAEHRPRDLALALCIGACIASYTLVDKHGVTHGNPLSYLQVVFSIAALGYLIGALRVRGARAIRAAASPATLLAGVGFFGSYALTLAALRLASAASVAAVRESSVVIAAFALVLSGREALHGSRLAGAALVAAGVALISLG